MNYIIRKEALRLKCCKLLTFRTAFPFHCGVFSLALNIMAYLRLFITLGTQSSVARFKLLMILNAII